MKNNGGKPTMKKPAEFLQGLGIGAGLIAAFGAVSLLLRPGLVGAGPNLAASMGKPVIEPRATVNTPAPLPPDYLDLCRNAGL